MIEAGQATTYLTSMIKGFKLEVTDAVDVVSKLTAVDMDAAASAGGIAAALQNVATTAQLAGVSLDETIAYATTIIETTQRDPSSVGMALRTIMSRYGNVKAGAYTKMNLESSSDTDLENLNDIEKVLGKIGINIRSTNTEFRSFSEVLDELGDKWATLDNVSKNAIATAMAGVRQREQFLVLMENLDRAEELEEVSQKSSGTAEKKYASYMETIESAQNRLSNAWSELAQRLEESGIVKFFTDLSVLFTKTLIPALNALMASLVSYNAYKVPTWITNLRRRGKVKGVGLFASADDIKESRAFWKEQNTLVKDEVTGKLTAKKAGSLSSFVDEKIVESGGKVEVAFGGATRAADNLAKSLNNAAGKASDETNIQPPPTAEEGGEQPPESLPQEKKKRKRKEEFKEKAKLNLGGAAAAGIVSSITTGMNTEGTTKAKAVAGAAAGAATALGALAGPIGAMIGSAVGSAFAPWIAEQVDRAKIKREEQAEEGSKQLAALKSSQKSIDELVSYSKYESFTSADIKSIKEYVAEIRDNTDNRGVAFRTALEGVIDKELLTSLGAQSFESLYQHLDTYLTDESEENRENREKLANAIRLANIEAQKEAYEASMTVKLHDGMNYDERLEYERKKQEYELQSAYYRSGVEELSTQQLAKIGIEGAAKKVAAKMQGVDESEAFVSSDLLRQITSLMKNSEVASVQNLMAGKVYTLEDIVRNTYNLSDEVRNKKLMEFASGLGVSIETVKESVDAFGSFTLGDLNSSFKDLKEASDALVSRFQKLSSEGSLGLEDLYDIVSGDTGEAAMLGEDFDYVAQIRGTAQLLGDKTKSKYRSNTSVWEALTKENIWGAGGFDEKTSLGGILEGVKSYDSAYKKIAGEMYDLKQAGKENTEEYKALADIWDKMIEHQTNAYQKIEEATAKYEKEILLGSYQSQIEKRIDREKSALEEQKQALQEINSQREYENKLIEAKIKLENAQNEKKKVWREGVGWVFEADTAAIAEAQKELEDLDNEKRINELQTLIDELQAQKDWMNDFLESENFKKAEEFLSTWATNTTDTRLMIQEWSKLWGENPKVDTNTVGNAQKDADKIRRKAEKENLEEKAKALRETEGYKILSNSELSAQQKREQLGQMKPEDIEAFNSARGAYETALQNMSNETDKAGYLAEAGVVGGVLKKGETVFENIGKQLTEQEFTKPGWKPLFANITQSGGAPTALKEYQATLTGKEEVLSQEAEVNDDSTRWNKDWRASLFYYDTNAGQWKYVTSAKGLGNSSGTGDILSNSELNNGHWLFNAKQGKVYYIKGGKVYNYGIKDVPSNATGTLSASGGPSLVNDDARYGLEGIITPQGTLTALPSKSGVVPADMTRNVWQLGELAPNLIKHLVDIDSKVSSPNGFGTDESFNVEHLDIHMVAQPGFNMDDFVRELEAARNQTRHL